MRKTFIVATTALVLLGGAATYAQQQPGEHGQGGHRDHERFSPEDLKAFTDAHIAALKTGLRLTADQEKNWAPVEQAIRAIAEARQARIAKWHDERGGDKDAIAKLRERADAITERAAQLRKLADAAEPLYKSLADDQKHRLRFLIQETLHHGQGGGGWRHHGGWQQHG